MIQRIPFPPYMPDQSQNSGVLLRAENVYPAADGYRPIRAIAPVSDALTETFMGGYSAIANDGSSYLLAGTTSAVYRYETDGSWFELASGMTVTGRWRFVQFGNYVVSVNGSATREVDLASATAAEIPGAPSGTSIATIGDHVVIGQAGGNVNLVRWCAFRDHTAWVNGTDQAVEQPMLTGGMVQYVAGGEYGVILQRERIVRMTRTGNSDAPFEFDEVSANFGCAAGETVAQAGRTIFFRSDRGFMALNDGQELKAIGSEKVDRTFAATISRDDYTKIYTAVDPENKLVAWGIPGAPGSLWIYNWELDRWATGSLAFSGMFPGFTVSFGLEDVSELYPNLDTMGISLDDPRFRGGNPSLYLVSADKELGRLTGDTLAVRLELGYNEFSPGRRSRVRGIRPITDAIDGLTIAIDAKARLGDSEALTTSSTLRTTGKVPIRSSGRYQAISNRYAAGTAWTFTQGFEVEFAAGGAR